MASVQGRELLEFITGIASPASQFSFFFPGMDYRLSFIQAQKLLIYVINKYVLCVAASVNCSEYMMCWL